MRNAKPCPTATFTHSVNHDGERNLPPRVESVICPGCGSQYERRHWSPPDPTQRRVRDGSPILVRICPACHRRESGLPHGFVHVDGDFAHAHHAEIEALLRNDAAHALEDNPLGQVMNCTDDGSGGLLLTTTTEHLAIRLGRVLEQAYDGRLLFGFSHQNKLAHVWWHRDR